MRVLLGLLVAVCCGVGWVHEAGAVIAGTPKWAQSAAACTAGTGLRATRNEIWNDIRNPALSYTPCSAWWSGDSLFSGTAPNEVWKRQHGFCCSPPGTCFINGTTGDRFAYQCATQLSCPAGSTLSGGNCTCTPPLVEIPGTGTCGTVAQSTCPTDPGQFVVSFYADNPLNVCVPNPAGGALQCVGQYTASRSCDTWGSGTFYPGCAGLGCEIQNASCPKHWTGASCSVALGTVNTCGAAFHLVGGVCVATTGVANVTQDVSAPQAGSPTAGTQNSTSSVSTTTVNVDGSTTTNTTTTVNAPGGSVVSITESRVVTPPGGEGSDLELPTDYNREATQLEILDALTATEGDLSPAEGELEDATDARVAVIEGTSGAHGITLSFLPVLPTPACDFPSFTVAGHTLDMTAWCPRIEILRQLIGLAFYIGAAFALYGIFTRSGGA